METVGEATWAHSLRALEPGGTVVVSGATSGPNPPADLARVFYRQLSIVGSTMGTRDELVRLVRLLEATGVRPLIDEVFALDRGTGGLRADARRRGVRQAGPASLTARARGAPIEPGGRWLRGPGSNRRHFD
jgi:NADPH:quinone reductase-like Zn-dependent oxidoreductase